MSAGTQLGSLLLVASVLAACGSGAGTARPQPPENPAAGERSSGEGAPPEAQASSSGPGEERTVQPRPARGTVPPAWLGTRVLPTTAEGFGVVRSTPRVMRVRRWNTRDSIPMLGGAGFEAIIDSPAPKSVVARSTWQPRCPVRKDELAWVRMTYWGFDDARHSGEMLTHRAAAEDLVAVFRRLYEARFPIEAMAIARPEDLVAPPTGDGNVTGSFTCRPIRGGTSYSQHAYGLAVDVNPFQNPYRKGDLVLPELASAYLDRGWRRPGMITADGVVTRAFASIGWEWGGAWSSLKDYQHFSATGG